MTFVSGSVTAIFSPFIHEKPEKSGSYGVGFTIDRGVEAEFTEKEGVFFNDKKVSIGPAEMILKELGGNGIRLSAELPISCGFGLSGASALACGIEVSIKRNLPLSLSEIADLAHRAEVLSKTGLGDVVTQFHGGVVARLKPGSPSTSEVQRYIFRQEIDFLVFGKLPTEDILEDDIKRESVKRAGKKHLREFLRKPNIENLFRCSKQFAADSGLMDHEIRDVIEAVENSGGMASMVMLGRAVFAVNGKETLEEFKGQKFSARIAPCGIKI